MTEYRVIWEIDIEADNPTEAAKKAREIQLNKDSIANFFEVVDRKTNEKECIDLEDE